MSDTPICDDIARKWASGEITLGQMRELFDELERENKELKTKIIQIANLAHLGGLDNLTEEEVLVKIRKLTIDDFDKNRSR